MKLHQLLACALAAYLMASGALTALGSAADLLHFEPPAKVAGALHTAALLLFGVLFGHGYPTGN